jgi:hypothetical protein
VTQVPLVPGDTDEEPDAYLYDALSGTFTWLSQAPSGGNGEFPARISSPIESFVFGQRPENRALSEDGSRAFFSTKEALLPEDVNEATDVYEWAEGSLGLVSPGTGKAEAEFAGASADGATVLFRTTESLLPRDQDGGEADLYAARLGGGFDETGAARAAGCAEICGPPVPPPAQGPKPRSAGHRPKPGKGALRLRSVAGAASALAAGRPAPIDVWVPAGGRVSATAAIVGRSGAGPAASGVAGAIRRGPVRVWLRGTERARRALRRDGSLSIRLEVREAKLRLTRHLRLRLGGGPSAGRDS